MEGPDLSTSFSPWGPPEIPPSPTPSHPTPWGEIPHGDPPGLAPQAPIGGAAEGRPLHFRLSTPGPGVPVGNCSPDGVGEGGISGGPHGENEVDKSGPSITSPANAAMPAFVMRFLRKS